MPAGAGTVGSRCHEVPWCMHTAYTATPVSVCSMLHTADTFLLLLLSNTQTSYLKLQSIYSHCLSDPQRGPEADAMVPFYRQGNWGRSIKGLSNTTNRSPSKSTHFNIIAVNCLYRRYQNHGNNKPCFRILSLHCYYFHHYDYYYFYFYRLQIRYVSSSFFALHQEVRDSRWNMGLRNDGRK